MSSIPYNYGKYVDDTQKLHDQGHVDAGKQVQSPASAGSRGLNKTVQFTKDPTQMKMGESITMEDIKTLISRIDRIQSGAEAVREDDRVEKAMKDMQPSKVTGYYEITDFWKEHTQMWGKDPETVKYEIADWMVDEMKPDNTPEREELTKRAWAIVDDALKNNKDDMTFDDMIDQLKSKGESAVREDDMRDMTISDLEAQLGKINDEITFLQIDQKDKESALAALGELRSVLDKYQSQKESAVQEDISDKGRIALEKAGFDPMKVKEYMAVFNDHGDTSDIDQMNMDKVGLADAMSMVLASHDIENESYEPFPEADEMTFEDDDAFYEAFGELGFPEDETELFDAEYRGRKVPLNKPMRGDVKKFKVYVKDPKSGNVKKVNFGHGGSSARKAGQKTMKIRKSNPKARKSFRARHNCANPGPKTKARYWSCRKW